MLKKIEATMHKHGMMNIKSILIGLSGGADSVALTHVLCMLGKKIGFKVYAAHINHGLRGMSADRDESFSCQFANDMNIDFFSLKVDVKSLAKKKGVSEELAGREVRYGYFNELCKEYEIDCIATAHHRNDNAETVLMNFMRGSGLKGLCGIPYKRDNIIRPLMDCTRAEIEKYCTENNLAYMTDETNLEEEYTRNKIRNSLIPMLEDKFNPSIVETVTRNAAVLTLEEDFLSGETEKAYKKAVVGNMLDVAAVNDLHKAVALRVIRRLTDEVCGNQDISQAVISAVYDLIQNNRTGTRTNIIRNTEARIEYGKLIIGEKQVKSDGFSYEVKIGEKLYIPELGVTVLAELTDGYKKDGAEYFSVPEGFSLCIRNRHQGDVFRPQGMNGTKKLKDFMIDRKISQNERDTIGIFTINEKIAWVMGYRRSAEFKFNGNGIKITIL